MLYLSYTYFIPVYGEFADSAQQQAIFGYPGACDKNSGEKNKEVVEQWELKLDNAVQEVRQSEGVIVHLISTLPGQSGSPIVDSSQRFPCVIGIHKGGKTFINNGVKQHFNCGKLLSEELIRKLASKAKEMNAEMFRLGKYLHQFILYPHASITHKIYVQFTVYRHRINRQLPNLIFGFYDNQHLQNEIQELDLNYKANLGRLNHQKAIMQKVLAKCVCKQNN